MPGDLSTVEPESFSVPAVPAGTGDSSITCQDDLDIPLSKLLSQSELPHVGEGDPPAEERKETAGQTSESALHKTPSPRFSSFLGGFRDERELQTGGPGIGHG